MSFSPDGKFVASGSKDTTVKICNVQTSKCIVTLNGHTELISCVSFSGNGKSLASSSRDKTLRIWVNINGGWFCDKIFSAVESPLSAHHAKVEQVIASKRNKKIIKQLVYKDEMNKKEPIEEEKDNESQDEETDETEGELSPNLTLARRAANQFSELILGKNIARYEEVLEPEMIHISQTNPRDNIKEKVKDEVSLETRIIPSNQGNPGDSNSKGRAQKKKNGCWATF